MRSMIERDPSVLMMSVCLIAGVLAGGGAATASPAPPGGSYADLLTFYKDFRAFQKPKLVGGVPDYTAAAMAAQQKELETYKARLAAIDPGAWPIPQQVDYYIVRAELNGLDFDHRVLKPWANNPGFYVTFFPEESDQPKREGPFAEGAVELWSYKLPLSKESAAQIGAGVRAIPGLLAQAKTNLTGDGRDLWIYGAKNVKQQSADLAAFAGKLGAAQPGLKADVERAKKATDDLAAWLDSQAASKTGPSGVGIENYDWYLKNVQLVPFTWAEEVALMQRELARSKALLAMEEIRNAKLPPQAPIATAAEYNRQFDAGVTAYMAFLRDNEILTVKPYMEPALRARLGAFSPGRSSSSARSTTATPRSCARTTTTGSTRPGWSRSRPRARSAGTCASTTSTTRAPRASRRAGKSSCCRPACSTRGRARPSSSTSSSPSAPPAPSASSSWSPTS